MFSLPPFRYVLPNLVTVVSTFCGFLMLFLAATSEAAAMFYLGAALVPIACVIDGFDGRVARMVEGQSQFGAELDSLSDMFTFGVGPAFLAYFWGLEQLGFIGLAVVFMYIAMSMIRLARFNVGASEGHAADRFFVGLPVPMAGMGIAAIIGLQAGLFQQTAMSTEAAPWFAVFVGLLSLLMVSDVPFRSFKDLRFTPVNTLFVGTVLSTVLVLSIAIDPLAGFGLAFFGYFLANLVGALLFGHSGVEVSNDEDPWGVFDEEWIGADEDDS